MLPYYNQKQLIAKVDEKGNVIGKIDKWEAHKLGILHKALTVTIVCDGKYVIQERKHPAFDKVFDVSSSSHQLFINEKLQSTEEATFNCLKREWNLDKSNILKIKSLGNIYYKASDPNSEFTEHEICEVMIAEVNTEPKPNLDYAYKSFTTSGKEIKDEKSEIYQRLAPWVKIMIKRNML